MESRVKKRKAAGSRKKQKTLTGFFLRYMVLFCVNTALVLAAAFGICTVVLVASTSAGGIYPANYAELWLKEKEEQIRTAETVSEELLPPATEYGVFSDQGEWLYGTFSEKEREKAWWSYENGNHYERTGYYYYIVREGKEVCVVWYQLYMQYASETLRHILPRPELLIYVVFAVLFLIQAWILARHFSKKLKLRLVELKETTRKIAENDLDFEVQAADIKEIDEVLTSMGKMKQALKDSLQKQWDMEAEQNRRLRALSHDIKTPLTIIRGNAELLLEDAAYQEQQPQKNSLDGILENVREMEQYLEQMRILLRHEKMSEQEICIAADRFQEELKEQARQIAAANNLPLMLKGNGGLKGTLQLNRDQIRRAWNNVLGNAVEYTAPEAGIDVLITEEEREGKQYLTAKVTDYGRGFSAEELQLAAEEFYRGDENRHDRSHQGLGLAIAKRFLESQGGFLEIRNSEKTGGGEVTLWLLILGNDQSLNFVSCENCQ